jgi:hypothetical protein
MLRRLAATLAGFVAFTLTLTTVEVLSAALFPLPAGLAMDDEAALHAWIASLPAAAFLLVLLGWALGSVVGGAVAAKVGRHPAPPRAVGVLGTLGAVVNNLSVPQPAWMWAGLLLFLPGALLGARLVRPPTP